VTSTVVWLNEQGVSIGLVRFRPYQLEDGRVLVNFTRIFPIPSVEDFTIGRRTSSINEKAPLGPGDPWNLPAFQRLAEQGNEATLAMLDLCAAAGEGTVSVPDIALHASITVPSVRGQLAGFTMRLRNPKYGFTQTSWPVDVTWLPGGVASYRMSADLVSLWKQAREPGTGDLSQNPSVPT